MKKIFLVSAVIILFMFGFFIPHLNAQEQQPYGTGEPLISMDFKNVGLKDLLKAFSKQSGLNFIASEAVQDRKVTLYMDKVPLNEAMDKIFSANNLSYELDEKANIFVVKEWGKMETETITKVFFLKNATVSTASLKSEMSKDVLKPSSSESASTSSSKAKWKEESEGGITIAVKKLLSPAGSLIEDFRTNSIIVTDTPMKLKVIGQVIESLDVPIPQVMLEVEMLDVSKNAVDKIGLEFGDTPFTAIVTGASATTGFPFKSWSKIFNPGNGSIAINTGTNTYQTQLDFIKSLTDTRYLARPRLLTLNNETAEIFITKDEIIGRKDTTTFSEGGSPTTTSEYQRSTDLALTQEGTGIFLRVTPQINLDTNEITMVVNPKSSVSNLSSLASAGNPQSDVEIRSTKSIVKVKDGETVVLGGLIHHDKNEEVKKLPILGDIPVIGMLFRHVNKSKDIERELIVFITPHIIRDKSDIKLSQIQNIPPMPVREQASVMGSNREYLISNSMNKFDKKR